jgi:hypothetical protein
MSFKLGKPLSPCSNLISNTGQRECEGVVTECKWVVTVKVCVQCVEPGCLGRPADLVGARRRRSGRRVQKARTDVFPSEVRRELRCLASYDLHRSQLRPSGQHLRSFSHRAPRSPT